MARTAGALNAAAFQGHLQNVTDPRQIRDFINFVTDLYLRDKISGTQVLEFAEAAAHSPSAYARMVMLKMVSEEISHGNIRNIPRLKALMNTVSTSCLMDKQSARHLIGAVFELSHLVEGMECNAGMGSKVEERNAPTVIA